MPEEITQKVADDLIAALLRRARMFVVEKDSELFDLAARVVFDGARFVGIDGLPTSRQFIDDYFQGIGPVLLAPPGWKAKVPPARQVGLVVHEGTHAGQLYADVKMAVWYLAHREARAGYEAEAYGAGYEWEYALTGQIPARVEDLPHALREGYALTPGDVELAKGLLEQRAASLANGVIATAMGRAAISLLWRRAPACLHPDAVARILAGSPGLLS